MTNQFVDDDYHPRITDHDREQVRLLHAEGHSRNEIARRIGRGGRTVSRIAAELGLPFDTARTEEATRQRVAQLAALRAETAVDLHLDAMRLTEAMWQPTKVFNFGGRENVYRDHDVDEPPAADKKALMAAAGIALEKSLRLVPPEREDLEGLAAVDAWLRGMMPDQ